MKSEDVQAGSLETEKMGLERSAGDSNDEGKEWQKQVARASSGF